MPSVEKVLSDLDPKWHQSTPAVFSYYVTKIESTGIKNLDDLLTVPAAKIKDYSLPHKV